MAKHSHPWWVKSDAPGVQSLRDRLLTAARVAWKEDAPRRERHENFYRIYSNRNVAGLQPDAFDDYAPKERQKIRVQITRTMIDAILARLSKNKPKPTALTQRGDFTLQSQAKRQDSFLQGVFAREKAYIMGRECLRDAMVFGDGIAKVMGVAQKEDGKLNGRIRYERTRPWELFVDRLESYYGTPRNLFQIHQIDRSVLAGLFEDKAGRIMDASSESIVDYNQNQSHDGILNDRVQVVEAWHLPSAPDAHDGRHVLTMHDLVVSDKEWKHDRFPFARIPWSGMMPVGYWSQSLVETSESIQREINELAGKIQVAMFYGSRPVLLVEEGSDIDEGDINNDVRGTIIRYRGTPPQFVAPQQLSNEVYIHLDRLIELAMNLEGVSEMSVASKKPAGLESGKALLDFNDIESVRFMPRGMAYEEFFLDLGHLTLMAARDLDAAEVPVEVTAETRKFRRRYIDKIKWKDVALDKDQFELKLMPSSSLPHTPAGRRQAVESLFEVGFLSRDQALELLELPDLEAVLSQELAKVELPLMQLESILEDGKLVPPLPMQPLPETLAAAQAAFMRGTIEDIDPTRLDLLSQFIQAIQQLIDAAKQAALDEIAALQPEPLPGAEGDAGALPPVDGGLPPVDGLDPLAQPPIDAAPVDPAALPI